VVVREELELEVLNPPPGATVTARMPTADERVRLDLSDGVPVLEVVDTVGGVQVLAADQWCLRWPQ
jgi:GntR family transcriptional regulator